MLLSCGMGTEGGGSDPFMRMAQGTAPVPLLWGIQGDSSATWWPLWDRGLAPSCVFLETGESGAVPETKGGRFKH